jgi:hypothetical protein
VRGTGGASSLRRCVPVGNWHRLFLSPSVYPDDGYVGARFIGEKETRQVYPTGENIRASIFVSKIYHFVTKWHHFDHPCKRLDTKKYRNDTFKYRFPTFRYRLDTLKYRSPTYRIPTLLANFWPGPLAPFASLPKKGSGRKAGRAGRKGRKHLEIIPTVWMSIGIRSKRTNEQ